MSGRGSSMGAGPPLSAHNQISRDHNQPMDLVQKTPTSRTLDASGSGPLKGVTTTLVHFGSQVVASNSPTHVITCKTGSTSSSTPPSAHSGYHIPRGAAVVANMTASRSQNLATIVRTSSQQVGLQSNVTQRTVLGGQRVVPISSTNWTSRSSVPTTVFSGKGPPKFTFGTARGNGTNTIVPVSSYQATVVPVTAYHGAASKPIRAPTARAIEANRQHVPTKALHIAHPLTVTQKYIPGGSNRNISQGGPITGMYTPSSSLVTSLASSGTTITPHPGNMGQGNSSVRNSNVPTQLQNISTSGGAASISLSVSPNQSSSGAVVINQQLPMGRAQPSSDHNIPIKTPIGRVAQITGPQFPLSKVVTQVHGVSQAPLTLAQLSTGIKSGGLKGSNLKNVISTGVKTNIIAGGKTIGSGVGASGKSSAIISTIPSGVKPGLKGLTIPSNIKATAMKTGGGSSHGLIHHNIVTSQTQGHSFQARPGSTISSSFGRLSGPSSVAKVIQGGGTMLPQGSHGTHSESQPAHASVFIHRASPVSAHANVQSIGTSSNERISNPQYSITTPYYFDSVNSSVAPSSIANAHYITSAAAAGSVSTSNLRVAGGITGHVQSSMQGVQQQQQQQHLEGAQMMKQNSSPRPSILRKRPDLEGSPLKAAKNLSSTLSLFPSPHHITSPPSPKRPESAGCSGSSTTMSANSSPGVQGEDDIAKCTSGASTLKLEHSEDGRGMSSSILVSSSDAYHSSTSTSLVTSTMNALEGGVYSMLEQSPSSFNAQNVDMISPRKKPRKQQLMGNELQESFEEEFQLHTIKKAKKEPVFEESESDEAHLPHMDIPLTPSKPKVTSSNHVSSSKDRSKPVTTPLASIQVKNENDASHNPKNDERNRRPHMTLIQSYKHHWKPRHNHFAKHTDVRHKEEKKRTVNEIASQKLSLQRVNGWKVVHLSGQVEDLADLEGEAVGKLDDILNMLEKKQVSRKPYKDFEKDVNKLSELVKANIQRSKIIKDQMADAKNQMTKLFDHKGNIVEILNKFSNKRTLRRKDKL